MWFFFSLLTILAWGGADLFYKLGADPAERYSHLKTVVMVGLVMGCHAVIYMLTGGAAVDFSELLRYLPVSALYILSMALGYFGLRHIELSVSSPVQNSSGAVTALLCCLFFRQSLSILELSGVAAVCLGVILLAAYESRAERSMLAADEKKRSSAAPAIVFPILYCLLDSAGTFLDAIYLGEAETAARFDWLSRLLADFRVMDEDAALVAYELTFLFCALAALVYLLGVKKEPLRIFSKPSRLAAAILETAGQYAYVYAMSGRAVIAAPMIASYSIVSVLLSRIFLREKLSRAQYALIALVMCGIALLGFFDA